VDDAKAPINTYGQQNTMASCRAHGAGALLHNAISWLFRKNGHNFIKNLLRWQKRAADKVVDDQVARPQGPKHCGAYF
jgi:dTDP-4-dehydrorhamnose reductase